MFKMFTRPEIKTASESDHPFGETERIRLQAEMIVAFRGQRSIQEYAEFLGIDKRYIEDVEAQKYELTIEQIAYLTHKQDLVKSNADATIPRLGDIYGPIAFPSYNDSKTTPPDKPDSVVKFLSEAPPPSEDLFAWEKPKVPPLPVPTNYNDLSTDELLDALKTWGLDQFAIFYHNHDQRWSMSWKLKGCSGGLEDQTFRQALLCCVGQIAREQERLGRKIES